MADRPYRAPIDHEKLGAYLRALSVPTRILLLEKLQLPHTPSEIELPPFRRDAGLRHDRRLSRQTVEQHLEVLEQAGLVRSRPTKRAGQPAREFLVNQERLFTLVDEMRRLALLRIAPAGGDEAPTGHAPADAASGDDPVEIPPGPVLLLVSGPFEGKTFALEGDGPWTIGRAPLVEVPLPFDPFVSARNTRVRREDGRLVVESLVESRNGTTLNWRLLEPGRVSPLAAGDTVGVGRSLLVVRGV